MQRSSVFYSFGNTGIDTHEFLTIVNKRSFLQSAISIGITVVWGPYGGYDDVVTRCSAHFEYENSNILFKLPCVCNPHMGVKEWFYTGCECNEGHPCICRTIPEQVD